jgi:hypothetical protein
VGSCGTWLALAGGAVRASFNAYVPLRVEWAKRALCLRKQILVHIAKVICNRSGP